MTKGLNKNMKKFFSLGLILTLLLSMAACVPVDKLPDARNATAIPQLSDPPEQSSTPDADADTGLDQGINPLDEEQATTAPISAATEPLTEVDEPPIETPRPAGMEQMASLSGVELVNPVLKKDGVTILPLQDVARALGYNVTADGDKEFNMSITMKKDKTTLVFSYTYDTAKGIALKPVFKLNKKEIKPACDLTFEDGIAYMDFAFYKQVFGVELTQDASGNFSASE